MTFVKVTAANSHLQWKSVVLNFLNHLACGPHVTPGNIWSKCCKAYEEFGHCILISGVYGSKLKFSIIVNGIDKNQYRPDIFTKMYNEKTPFLHVISLTLLLFLRSHNHGTFSHLKLLTSHKLLLLSFEDFYYECIYICWRTTLHTSTRSVWPLSRSQQ